ncbi:hypothetical protein Tco_0532619 [Tanacetum coccineum]
MNVFDVPSSVTETTDTTSTLPPPPPPLQKPTGSFKDGDGDGDTQFHYHPGKANVVADALSKKEKVKPKRLRAMNMTLQSSIKDKILAAQKEVVDESAGLHKGLDEMIEPRSDRTLNYLDRI